MVYPVSRAISSSPTTDSTDHSWNEMTFGSSLLSTYGAQLNATLANRIPREYHPSGSHHRRQRKLLNPAFSTSHMREMTPAFYSVVHRVRFNSSNGRVDHHLWYGSFVTLSHVKSDSRGRKLMSWSG